MTAYHEAGHALLAWLLPGARPRAQGDDHPARPGAGRHAAPARGRPHEHLPQRELAGACWCMLLGGRAAEKLVYDEYSVGAENDLEQATGLARRMVTHWGMSERLGPVSYQDRRRAPLPGQEIHEQRQFSEHTAQIIDEEVARILHEAFDEAQRLLQKHRDKLDILATALEQREELDETEIAALIGPSANQREKETGGSGLRTTYRADAQTGGETLKKEGGDSGATGS